VRYFLQGVACPFLEAESCGIHPDRPLACREYLVTSRRPLRHPGPRPSSGWSCLAICRARSTGSATARARRRCAGSPRSSRSSGWPRGGRCRPVPRGSSWTASSRRCRVPVARGPRRPETGEPVPPRTASHAGAGSARVRPRSR
jgi:hypothetical protein